MVNQFINKFNFGNGVILRLFSLQGGVYYERNYLIFQVEFVIKLITKLSKYCN